MLRLMMLTLNNSGLILFKSNGVISALLAALTSAPDFKSNATMLVSPHRVAKCRGVSPAIAPRSSPHMRL